MSSIVEKTGSKAWFFQWEARHLFEEIFPGFTLTLEQTLIDLVNNNGKDDLEIALSVISKRHGEDFLFGIIKAIVSKYQGQKKYEEETKYSLFGYLSQTGVVMGEDGLVLAYQSKKAEVQKFKTDPSAAMRSFVIEYEKSLDTQIIHEKKRTEEGIEIRKREFGS